MWGIYFGSIYSIHDFSKNKPFCLKKTLFYCIIILMKLWIKTQSGEKITADAVITVSGQLTANTLSQVLRENLDKMDIPTPMVLPVHAKKLKSFNVVRFRPDDFVEYVDFDVMIIELIRDKQAKSVS